MCLIRDGLLGPRAISLVLTSCPLSSSTLTLLGTVFLSVELRNLLLLTESGQREAKTGQTDELCRA